MSKPNKYARELLEAQIDLPIGCHSSNLAEACKKLLAVLDAAASQEINGQRYGCGICGALGSKQDPHTHDCPVAACIEAGLEKK